MRQQIRVTYKHRMRPPAPGCQPGKGLIESFEAKNPGPGCWGYSIYNRELTEKEVREYDLDLVEIR